MRLLGIIATDAMRHRSVTRPWRALASTSGRGDTNSWRGHQNAADYYSGDGSAAEAHRWVLRRAIEAKTTRRQLIVRSIHALTAPPPWPTIRTADPRRLDIVFLGGIINWLIANDKIHWDCLKALYQRQPDRQRRIRIRRGLCPG